MGIQTFSIMIEAATNRVDVDFSTLMAMSTLIQKKNKVRDTCGSFVILVEVLTENDEK